MILALDISKRSTGFALWEEGSHSARYGTWILGSELTPNGATYCKLHQQMHDLYRLSKFEHLFFEEPLHPAKLQGHTNIDSIRVLSGLAAHAESFGEAMGMRTINAVNLSSWRSKFIGPQKRGTKRVTLKELSIERCRQLGWKPKNDDEADALGILDYACTFRGIVPPWRAHEQLALGGGGA
jgi:hypothetical protein